MNAIEDAQAAIDGGALSDVEQGIAGLHRHMHADPKTFYTAERRDWLKRTWKRLQADAASLGDLVRG